MSLGIAYQGTFIYLYYNQVIAYFVNMSTFRTSLGICVAFALFSASCKPDKEPTPDMGLKTDIPAPELPIVDGVYGALYSLKIYETQNGDKVKSESATAAFYDVPSNTANATQ